MPVFSPCAVLQDRCAAASPAAAPYGGGIGSATNRATALAGNVVLRPCPCFSLSSRIRPGRWRDGSDRDRVCTVRRGRPRSAREAAVSTTRTATKPIEVNGIRIDDTFAEAFGMSATGVIVTADSAKWARQAAVTMSGLGTSVIGCGAECGIDRELSPKETPDGRPGVRVLLFGFSPDALLPQLKNRVGQCVLTSPGSACFNGVESSTRLKLSAGIRYFGDGWQTSKKLGGRRF